MYKNAERVVRLLIESDSYNQYACKMVRYKGKDLTTVGNMLVELSAEIKKAATSTNNRG